MTILAHAGYYGDVPFFDTLSDGSFERHELTQKPITLRFDVSTRYCTGWHNLDTGANYACPEGARVDKAYTQCSGCQRRTGFNPAFYHATTVSEQQTRRNQEPHILYLAYFSADTIKVGISHAARGLSRLQEQGARAAAVLQTFPSALIARQYEQDISGLDGFVEHVSSRRKRELWKRQFTIEEASHKLEEAVERAGDMLAVQFADVAFHAFGEVYLFDQTIDLGSVEFTDDTDAISGTIVGCVGTELITRYDDRLLALNLRKFAGYEATIRDSAEPIELAPVQASLF